MDLLDRRYTYNSDLLDDLQDSLSHESVQTKLDFLTFAMKNDRFDLLMLYHHYLRDKREENKLFATDSNIATDNNATDSVASHPRIVYPRHG